MKGWWENLNNTYNKSLANNTYKQSPGNRRFARNNFRRNDSKEEPFEVMLRRFFRDVQHSGILTETKKRRFHEKGVSRKILREAARRKAARKKIKRGY